MFTYCFNNEFICIFILIYTCILYFYDKCKVLLYCIVLYCIVLYCIVLYCIALHCIALPCHAMPCHAMPCHAMPCHAMPCHAMPCHAMPCHAMPCIVRYQQTSWFTSIEPGLHPLILNLSVYFHPVCVFLTDKMS